MSDPERQSDEAPEVDAVAFEDLPKIRAKSLDRFRQRQDEERRAGRDAGEKRVDLEGPHPFEPPPEVRSAPLSESPVRRSNLAPPPVDRTAWIDGRVRDVLDSRYWEVSWENLALLRDPDTDALTLGTVEFMDGRRLAGPAAVAVLQNAMRGRNKVVLLGGTGAAKTFVAAAAVRSELARGVLAGWMSARNLKDPKRWLAVLPEDARDQRVQLVVLDNLGYEIHGAKAESGWIPGNSGPARDFLDALYDRGVRQIVTTFLDEDELGKFYDVGPRRRVYDGAEVIRLFVEGP
jgi:hypothetical protein